MKINYRKLFSIAVLLLITILFFKEDIETNYIYLKNQLIDDVKITYESQMILSMPSNPTFRVVVDTTKDNIDLNSSKVQIYGSDLAYEGWDENEVFLFHPTKVLSEHKLNSQYVTTTEENGQTILTVTNDREIQEGSTIYVQTYITTADGKKSTNGTTATMATNWFEVFEGGYSYYIQYLVWYLAIFGATFVSRSWSVVYDTKTKEPILGAVVRIFKDNSLYQSFVTGQTGVIYTELEKGKYKISTMHPQYAFPSKLSPLTSDGEYHNLYYGNDLEIKGKKGKLKINIPVDPKEDLPKPTVGQRISNAIATTVDQFNTPFMIFVSVIQIIIYPTYIETYLYMLITGVLVFWHYYLKRKAKTTPGLVIDSDGNYVANLKINLYDAQWNRLVQSTVTNEKGEYEFIVPYESYYLTVDSNIYEMEDEKIEINATEVKKQATIYVNSKIVVRKKSQVTPLPLDKSIPQQSLPV